MTSVTAPQNKAKTSAITKYHIPSSKKILKQFVKKLTKARTHITKTASSTQVAETMP
jgi:hypothetical protein